MNKIKCFFAVAGLGLFLSAAAQAKEEKVIQFTTLPEVVRTTVIHRYNIVSPEKVTRVVEYPGDIYQLTIVTDSGEQVIYVNAEGAVVERPSTVVTETEQGGPAEVTITMDEVTSGGERYEFVEDQGPDAIYIDHQTNKRVMVKGGAGKGNRGGVRTKEENSVRTKEGSVRTKDENEGSVRTKDENEGKIGTKEENKTEVRSNEKTKQEPAVREKTEEKDSNRGDMKQGQRTEEPRATHLEQKDQKDRENVGNGQERKDKDTENPRTVEKTTEQKNAGDKEQKMEKNGTRTPGEQQTKEKGKDKEGKEKTQPTP